MEIYDNNYSIGSVRQIDSDTSIPTFDCGNPDLNEFAVQEAWLYQKARLSTAYIMESTVGHVDGYISLANDRISLSDFENRTEFNRFRKKDFRMPNALKVTQLSKSAV